MSDEKELTHGFEIHAGTHTHALEYMKTRMDQRQVEDMVHTAKNGHSAEFQVNHNGKHMVYKLMNEGGTLRIHHA